MKSLVAVFALVLTFTFGCAGWRPDGELAGVVPVDSLEGPLNLAYPGAGSVFVKVDQALAARYKTAPFPLESVATNYFDANNQEIVPPFRRVETPVYGPRVTEIGATKPAAAPVDTAALAKLLQTLQAAQPGAQGDQPAVVTDGLTDAEKAALRALGISVP